MYKVAMVGWGMSAKTFHLPYIEASEDLALAAIVTSQHEACRERYPNVTPLVSIDDVLAFGGIDVAVVATPNFLHFQQCMQLLSAGIHVVVDKPATLTADEAYTLFNTARANGVWLAVFHNRRWDGDFLGLQRAIGTGSVGVPRVFNSHFDRFRPLPRNRWREHDIDGAGIWYDLGPHLVDQALCLFGRPEHLSASLRTLRDGAKTVDYAAVTLHYPALEVVLRSSPYCADPALRFQLETDRGTWRTFGLDPQEDQLKTGLSPGDPAWALTLPSQHAVWTDPDNGEEIIALPPGDYAAFYRRVALALAGEGQGALAVTAQQAIDVATIIETAVAASHQGRVMVPAWQAFN